MTNGELNGVLWLSIWLVETVPETVFTTTCPETEPRQRPVKAGLRGQESGASRCRKVVDFVLKTAAVCPVRTGCLC